MLEQFHGTTILAVRKGDQVIMGGDGQVTVGDTILKSHTRKIRKIYQNKVLAGFAGATADAFTLLDLFEAKLQKHQGNLVQSAIELAKDWRLDKRLRRLEAMLAVADAQSSLLITGSGDVLEPEDGIIAIGSGGNYALAAARALSRHAELPLRDLVQVSLNLAADICIYTNHNILIEEL